MDISGFFNSNQFDQVSSTLFKLIAFAVNLPFSPEIAESFQSLKSFNFKLSFFIEMLTCLNFFLDRKFCVCYACYRGMEMGKRVPVNLTIDEDIIEEFRLYMERTGLSMSNVIQHFMEGVLRDETLQKIERMVEIARAQTKEVHKHHK